MIRIKIITLLLILLLPNGYGIIAEDNKQPTPESIRKKKIEEYRQKLTSNSNDIKTHRAYQNLMRELGKLEDAQEEYILKLVSEPQNPLYFYLYGRLLEDKELEDAFKKAIELEIKSPNQELRFWLYFGLGQFYKDTKKYKEALQHLETAAKLKPDSLDVLHQIALVYYDMDNIAEAMNIWDKILQAKKDYMDAMLGKALIYKSRGMYDNAINELENILKINAAFWRAYEPLIQCYHAKQDYKKGEGLRTKIKNLYKETKDTDFKKKYLRTLMIIDIIKIEKRILIVKERIGTFPLHAESSAGSDCYYFEIYDEKQPDKNPLVIYLYRDFLGNYILSKGTEQIKSYNKPFSFPSYSELLDLIKSIEK